jgi:Pyridoxamine 5'-phosphate oxidase
MNDDVRALVEGPNYAHLATLMPDGAPHCVPRGSVSRASGSRS